MSAYESAIADKMRDKPDLNIVRTAIDSLPSYGLAAGSELIRKSDALNILDTCLPQHSKTWKSGK